MVPLPLEILEQIFHLLVKDAEKVDDKVQTWFRIAFRRQGDLLNVALVCREWNDAANNVIWSKPQFTMRSFVKFIQAVQDGTKNVDLIKKLDFGNVPYLCSHLNDSQLMSLSKLSCLNWLSLDYCSQITDDGLLSLLLNDSLVATRLKYLSLQGCFKLTNVSIVSIVNFAGPHGILRHLNLKKCHKLTDASLKAIVDNLFPTLQLLDMGSTLVTDSGLMYLASVSKHRLKHVGFAHCSKLSRHGMHLFLHTLLSPQKEYDEFASRINSISMTVPPPHGSSTLHFEQDVVSNIKLPMSLFTSLTSFELGNIPLDEASLNLLSKSIGSTVENLTLSNVQLQRSALTIFLSQCRVLKHLKIVNCLDVPLVLPDTLISYQVCGRDVSEAIESHLPNLKALAIHYSYVPLSFFKRYLKQFPNLEYFYMDLNGVRAHEAVLDEIRNGVVPRNTDEPDKQWSQEMRRMFPEADKLLLENLIKTARVRTNHENNLWEIFGQGEYSHVARNTSVVKYFILGHLLYKQEGQLSPWSLQVPEFPCWSQEWVQSTHRRICIPTLLGPEKMELCRKFMNLL